MNLRRKTNRTEDFEAKTRITYVLETNKKVIDTTVIGYVDASPQVSVESTRSYVLTGMQAALKWDQGDLVRWWVEDGGGNVLEFHDDDLVANCRSAVGVNAVGGWRRRVIGVVGQQRSTPEEGTSRQGVKK